MGGCRHLFDLCHIYSGSSRTVAAVIYGRTPTLEARITLISDLIETAYPKKPGEHDHPNLVTWNKIKTESKRLIPTRNVIVHAPAAMQAKLNLEVLPDLQVDTWVELYAAEHDKLRGKGTGPLKMEQVKQHRADATDLAKRVSSFVNFLRPPKRRKRRFREGPAIPSRTH